MAYIKVQPDFTGGNQIEIAQKPDSSGTTVDRQIISLGANEQEVTIVELLTAILNEIRALRFQYSEGMNVLYEPIDNYIQPNQS